MKRKIIFIFSIVFILLTISTVSANDNSTDDFILSENTVDHNNFNSTSEVNSINTLKSINSEKKSQQVISNENQLVENVSEKNISTTIFSASDKISYVDYDDIFKVKLESNGIGLANKNVKIILNGVTYNKKTNANGIASVEFKLKSKTYNVMYFFDGDYDYAASNGTSKITVKSNIVTSLNVVNKKINYRQGVKSIFQVKLLDVHKKAISGKFVVFKVHGKKYKVKTNSKGYATVYLSLKKGNHIIKYYFSDTGKYLSSSGKVNVTVKPKIVNGDGYWINKWSMNKVNLKVLAKKGTKNIFLQHTVFSKYGVKKVLKWIDKAHKYGINVHIWISVFYKNGKFVHPVSKNGKFNYKYMNKIIKQAKYYTSLKSVDGIHFDYLRFSGNAYKYKNAVKGVNYFVKKASNAIHKVNPDIFISAAVMPEPTSMKHYYAQDIPTMSKYFDAIVPMIYKGNYHASSKWIKKITKQFVKQSKGAQIWAGLQTYKSDYNLKKLSYNSLLKDAKNAKNGGASGIVLFRWGLSALLNFKKV